MGSAPAVVLCVYQSWSLVCSSSLAGSEDVGMRLDERVSECERVSTARAGRAAYVSDGVAQKKSINEVIDESMST